YLKLLFETGCADISVRGRMGSGDAVGKHGIFLKPTIILCRSLSEHPQCAAGAPRCAKYIARATMTDFAMPERRYAQRRHQYHLSDDGAWFARHNARLRTERPVSLPPFWKTKEEYHEYGMQNRFGCRCARPARYAWWNQSGKGRERARCAIR